MNVQIDVKPEAARSTAATIEAITPVLAEYAEALEVPVRMEVPNGLVARPRGRRGWWLHPFALPTRPALWGLGPRVGQVTLTTVCGYRLPPGRQAAWRAGARGSWGRPLKDEDEQTVGLLRQTDVYILFDLLAQEPEMARILTRTILDMSLEAGRNLLPLLTGLGPATVESRLRRLKQTSEIEAFQASSLWRADRHSEGAAGEAADALTRELTELERDLATSGRQLRSLERRLTLAERRLTELGRQEASLESLMRDFQRLTRLPGVTDVEVRDGVLRVFTEVVIIPYGTRRYRLGRFRLDLHFDGRVFLRNLTNRHETYDHPHVDSGRPCLGNIQEWIHRLLAQREFVAACEVLLQYLWTVNPADWRKAVTFWPEVSE
jgi:hypothetical protein